jgi:hypothetical protein
MPAPLHTRADEEYQEYNRDTDAEHKTRDEHEEHVAYLQDSPQNLQETAKESPSMTPGTTWKIPRRRLCDEVLRTFSYTSIFEEAERFGIMRRRRARSDTTPPNALQHAQQTWLLAARALRAKTMDSTLRIN